MKLTKSLLGAGLFGFVSAVTPFAQADVVYDLSITPTVVIPTIFGPAIFTTNFNQPTGTGVFDPFLSIQEAGNGNGNSAADGIEEGYSTSYKQGVMDTKREPQWNHEVTINELNQNALTIIDGVGYYAFLIDINEPNDPDKAIISLDALKVYTSPTAGLHPDNPDDLGPKRFDMDLPANSYIKYYDANHGSGQSDIKFFIPIAGFLGFLENYSTPNPYGPTAAAGTDYVYMYQKFGSSDAITFVDGGFEETAFGGRAIPEVSSILPLVGVLGMVFGVNRYRRRSLSVG